MKIDKTLLDDLTQQAKHSPRLRMNFDLRNGAGDSSQRMLNALLPGTPLPIHRHPSTAETVVLLRGKMDEVFYEQTDGQVKEVARVHLGAQSGNYGLQIPQGAWHTVEVFEPSVIIEMKDGAYQPISPEDILNK